MSIYIPEHLFCLVKVEVEHYPSVRLIVTPTCVSVHVETGVWIILARYVTNPICYLKHGPILCYSVRFHET
jgi:hypothetical protein